MDRVVISICVAQGQVRAGKKEAGGGSRWGREGTPWIQN